jgi:ribosome-associated heat shock protein Hsp15
VDRWLWAVRRTKTRPDAAAACRGGHVRINERPAKPSTTVSPGDEVRARVGETTRIVEVVRVIQKRVGAADAVTCFLDRTPKAPPTVSVPVALRDRGAGRPTKRDRRALDKWRAGQDRAGLGNDVGSRKVDVWDDERAPSERTPGSHD